MAGRREQRVQAAQAPTSPSSAYADHVGEGTKVMAPNVVVVTLWPNLLNLVPRLALNDPIADT